MPGCCHGPNNGKRCLRADLIIMRKCFNGRIFFLLVLFSMGWSSSIMGHCMESEWDIRDTTYVDDLLSLAWKSKTSQIADALRLSESAREIATQIGYETGVADAIHVKGMLYWYRSDYPRASELFWEALGLREQINDALGLGRSYNNIGNIFFYQAQYDTAKFYYQKALELRQELKDSAGLVYSYSNLGDVYLAKGKDLLALEYYQRGWAMAQRIPLVNGQGHIAGRLGEFYSLKGDHQQARTYWEESSRLASAAGNKHYLAESLIQLTRLAMLDDQFDLAKHEAFSRQALSLARDLGAIELQAEASLLLTQLAAAAGKYDSAYHFHQQYQELAAHQLEDRTSRNIANIQAKYESEQEAREARDAERLSKQHLFQAIIIILGLLVLLIGSFYGFKNRSFQRQRLFTQILKEKNQEILEQNKTLTRKNEVLDQFVRSASHDLKEPLRNVGAYASLIRRRYAALLDKEGKEYLDFVGHGVKQMYQVLDDLLVYSQASKLPVEKQVLIDFNLLLQEVNGTIIDTYDRPLILSSQSLPTIKGYPKLLRTLLTQLLSNALVFTRQDVVHVHIGYEKKKELHVFWVEDDGIGIDPRFHKQIFEPFQRLERQLHQGTGIGLALCRRILGHHGGSIWVESKAGQGSRFFFSLPVQRADVGTAKKEEKKKVKTLASFALLS